MNDMHTLKRSIQQGRFAWEKYLNGKMWNGIQLQTSPIFCSYGQIGYLVDVYDKGWHTATFTHDLEMNTTTFESAI